MSEQKDKKTSLQKNTARPVNTQGTLSTPHPGPAVPYPPKLTEADDLHNVRPVEQLKRKQD